MANRLELIDQVRVLLAKGGFAVSERCDVRPISFDVIARRDNKLFILKVLGNVDAFSERVAQELRTLAKFLRATPCLIGERSGAGDLEDGVVYTHRGIPVMTVSTLAEEVLENSPPMAYATPGGINVELDGVLLRRLREERALSLGLLAEVAGVSRRAIQMYEEGMRGTIDAALRLEEFLGEALVRPVDPHEVFRRGLVESPPPAEVPPQGLEADVFRLLRTVGFQVVPTRQSPFEAVSQKDTEAILTGVGEAPDANLRRRAQIINSVATIAEQDGMIVVRSEVRWRNIEGTPVVASEELRSIADPADLQTLLDERRKRASS